jgi:putative transposase
MSIPLIYKEETDYLTRTEQIWIKSNDLLSNLCHIAKNLYNEANYIIRQEFTKKDKDGNPCGAYLTYNVIYYLIKDKSKNYRSIPSQTAQQILKILDRNWKSFFVAIKDWKIHPEKYLGRPKLPGYLKKDGEFVLYFTDQQIGISDSGRIKFPKMLNVLNYKIPIKTRIKSTIRELRIIPMGKKIGYLIDLVYRKEVKKISNLDKDRVIGLDFGLRNFVTIPNNIGKKSICIKGGVLKSINQYYNKKLAELKSIYSKQYITIKGEKKQILTGPAIQILTNNRNKKIKDVMHKYSRFVTKCCLNHNVGTIVIGYNPEWKQEINLGKKTNQSFVQIPFYQFINMIKYKAEEIGISVIEQDESHTSKCSFLDDESVEHHDIYMGKRISRGLFRSKNGKIINADVQGALNTIKKAIPKAFGKLEADRIEDEGLHPLRINPLIANRNVNIIKG